MQNRCDNGRVSYDVKVRVLGAATPALTEGAWLRVIIKHCSLTESLHSQRKPVREGKCTFDQCFSLKVRPADSSPLLELTLLCCFEKIKSAEKIGTVKLDIAKYMFEEGPSTVKIKHGATLQIAFCSTQFVDVYSPLQAFRDKKEGKVRVRAVLSTRSRNSSRDCKSQQSSLKASSKREYSVAKKDLGVKQLMGENKQLQAQVTELRTRVDKLKLKQTEASVRQYFAQDRIAQLQAENASLRKSQEQLRVLILSLQTQLQQK